jgi:hypothetical protein
MSHFYFAGLFWCVEITMMPPVRSISDSKAAPSQLQPSLAQWPRTAPVPGTSLINPAEGSKGTCCWQKPAYLDYPPEWKPDGLVAMRAVSSDDDHHVMQVPSARGTWEACCYTSAKANDLGVDMQGYRLGTPEHEHATRILLQYSDHPTPQCLPKQPAQASMHDTSSSKNLRYTRGAVGRIGSAQRVVSDADAYDFFNKNGDDNLDLLETLVLAHQLPYKQTQRQAFPFGFQHQVMKSILSVDMDGDREVTMHPNEFKAWYDSVQNGTLHFAFDF